MHHLDMTTRDAIDAFHLPFRKYPLSFGVAIAITRLCAATSSVNRTTSKQHSYRVLFLFLSSDLQ